jgi:hypothetical protein
MGDHNGGAIMKYPDYKIKEKNQHFIYIKQMKENGEIFYSKIECKEPDFYSSIMEREFDMRRKND